MPLSPSYGVSCLDRGVTIRCLPTDGLVLLASLTVVVALVFIALWAVATGEERIRGRGPVAGDPTPLSYAAEIFPPDTTIVLSGNWTIDIGDTDDMAPVRIIERGTINLVPRAGGPLIENRGQLNIGGAPAELHLGEGPGWLPWWANGALLAALMPDILEQLPKESDE